MPELPEVETIRSDLEKNIVGKKITDVAFVWTGILKSLEPHDFKKIVMGKSILGVGRRAKNIYIKLEGGLYLLLHMKMTGHLIFTDKEWEVSEDGRWITRGTKESPLYDPLNQFIRAVFYLDDDKILAFSDLRKFAYLKLVDETELKNLTDKYGPEPLTPSFTANYLADKFKPKKTSIKKAIMDQAIIAGVGNIYADEILWASKINPLTAANLLSELELRTLVQNTQSILRKAVRLRGTSTSDFRDTEGKKGTFGSALKVYRMTNLPCPRDGTPIRRIVVGGRGTHFCPSCQKEKDV